MSVAPGFPPSHLLIIVNWSVNSFDCVVLLTSNECHANPILWTEANKTNKNWLPQQRPLRDRTRSSAIAE